jgi:hypothetical protein
MNIAKFCGYRFLSWEIFDLKKGVWKFFGNKMFASKILRSQKCSVWNFLVQNVQIATKKIDLEFFRLQKSWVRKFFRHNLLDL